MKMITKTFETKKGRGFLAVEELINDQLRKPFCCWCTIAETLIYSVKKDHARCRTPMPLVDALWGRRTITFSITLPAKYWKKEMNPTPPRDVHLPKFQTEKEKQRAINAAAFAKTLKPSKWLK